MSVTIILMLLLVAAFIVATKPGLLKKHGAGQGAEHWPVLPKKVLAPFARPLIAIAALAALSAHASDCYSIKDPDARSDCLARTK